MTNKNDIKKYTAEDISRYWQGKLSQQEMHAMEMAAMDDPFLADAMEGYSNWQPEETTKALADLQQQLQTRTGGNVVAMKPRNNWWRIAAAIILLCGTAALTYTLIMKQNATPNKQVAKQESTNPDTSLKVYKAPPVTNNDTSAITATTPVLAAEAQQKRQEEEKKDLVAKRQQASDDATGAALEALKKDTQDIAQDRDDALANVQRSASAPPVVSPANKDAINEQERQNRMERASNAAAFNNFSGRVVDPLNNAIPNATIYSNNTQVATANAQGIFNLRSSDTVMDLSINSSGYLPRQLTLRGNTATPDVILEPQQGKMKEVVVTGYGSAKKSVSTKSSDLKIYTMDAAPVDGWDAYNDYIQKNKRVEPNYEAIKGEVIVSFSVGKRGQLSAFAIEQSLSPKQDAEALRLVKEGPAWKLTKGKKTRARVIIPF